MSASFELRGAEIRVAADQHVPAHLREGMLAHILHGTPTGGFLLAVFHNDLAEAAVRADPVSLYALPAIMRFIRNDAPADCWGSTLNVARWRTAGGLLNTQVPA